jgi:hypothetical protein
LLRKRNYLLKGGYSDKGGDFVTFEQALIVEMVGLIKWIALGLLLITFAVYHINKIVNKRARIAERLITMSSRLIREAATDGIDHLIKELDNKAPRE